jgi:hypothetical protein
VLRALKKIYIYQDRNPMGLTIIMGNVRGVMCKVSLTSMHKSIRKYHFALVSSPRSSEPNSKKNNISNKNINNSEPTPFLKNINTVNPKFQLFIHPLLTYKILLLLAKKCNIPTKTHLHLKH